MRDNLISHLKSNNVFTPDALIPVGVLLLNLLLVGGFALLLNSLSLPFSQLCTRSTARTLLLALGVTFLINIALILVWRKVLLKTSVLSLCVLILLGSVTFWLGSYRYSPFSNIGGKFPILQGFLVTRQGRINEMLTPEDVILLSYGSPMGISVAADLPDMNCHWTSSNRGALDNSEGCDLVYSPPPTEYDILTVKIGSKCLVHPIQSQIKISILP